VRMETAVRVARWMVVCSHTYSSRIWLMA
jgi:hypothetical protein